MILVPNPLPYWLTITPTNIFPAWKLVRVEYVPTDDPRNNGSTNIYCKTLDKHGVYQQGIKVFQDWGDDRASENTKKQGDLLFNNEPFGCSFFQSGDSSFDPAKGQVGAYTCYVDGNSDKLGKMGLPLRRHVQYLLVWQWADTPTPTPPDPTPTPTGHWALGNPNSHDDPQLKWVTV